MVSVPLEEKYSNRWEVFEKEHQDIFKKRFKRKTIAPAGNLLARKPRVYFDEIKHPASFVIISQINPCNLSVIDFCSSTTYKFNVTIAMSNFDTCEICVVIRLSICRKYGENTK